ncbi:MAG: AsmA family protein [Woeseiaceae bacterium]
MSRFAKFLGWLVAALVALFAIAAVAFFLFFDANDFREEIGAAVQKATGRELVIEGDVALNVFPWLAVDVGSSKLGNAKGFGDTPFASFERAQLSVRLLPLLFRQQVVVGAINVDGLVLNLEEDRRGVTNWDDLLAVDTTAQQEQATASADAAVDVASTEFANGTINYYDAASNSRYALNDADLRIGPVTGTRKNLLIDGLSLKGRLEGVGEMPTAFKVSMDSIGLQTVEQVVTLAPLEMTVLGMDMTIKPEPFSYADSVLPTALLKIDAFSPRSLMTVFGTEPPETADPVALSRVIIDATAALKQKTIELTDVTLKLDDTTFRGSLSVPRSSTGTYQFNFDADRIDLTRYMEPAADAGTGARGESVPTEIPVDLIRPLNARGNLRVTNATLGNLEFENVVLGLNAANGRLRLNPIKSGLLGGSYDGDVRIDASGKTPVLSVDEKIVGVNLAALAKAMFAQENITGAITGNFTLTGRGQDMDAVQRSLAGNMAFELSDGSYEGTDIWFELRRARALLKRESPPQPVLPARTKFSSVTATGVVKDGVMQNNDLFAELPFMQLRGSGSVDLAAATVDYGLTARVLKKPESMTGVTEAELNDFTEAVIPLKITGALTSPSVKPDVEGLVRARLEESLKGKLLDKLRKRDTKEPPVDDTPTDAAPTEDAPAAEEPAAEEPKSVEEQAKDELKKKLKGLFD